jgi:hypothetical protein
VTHPFVIVPYDADRHAPFVFRAVTERAHDWPYGTPESWDPHRKAWLRAQVAEAEVLVAEDRADRDVFYGWLATSGLEVVMAFTKESLRGPGNWDAPVGARHEGVASALLALAGIPWRDKPTPVRIWSAAASRIAARGYPIYPTVTRGM